MKHIELVKNFNKVFDFPIRTLNEVEPLESRQLRIKLLFEELQELAQAGDVCKTFYELCYSHVEKIDDIIYSSGEEHFIIKDGNNVDKVEELDAITDIDYLLNGKLLSSGLHEVSEEAFQLVHANNMFKLHEDFEHAEETVNKLKLLDFDYQNVLNDKREFIGTILYNKDGKLTKPHDHKKVDLKQLFE